MPCGDGCPGSLSKPVSEKLACLLDGSKIWYMVTMEATRPEWGHEWIAGSTIFPQVVIFSNRRVRP